MDRSTDLDGGNQSGSASTARPVGVATETNAWDSYDTVFLNAKAGMDKVDKKKVQKVVYDMSKGSKYFNNEQRKEAEVLQRIQRMNFGSASLTPAELDEHQKATDLKIAELEASRDLSRIWVHVDMDAFYAAVETLVNPALACKPMAVGGMSMICTANYEARKFGVRAAMPGFIARKLCPSLIFVRPDFKKYSHYSDLSRQVFKDYDPDFVSRSMDEAYLEITKTCQLRNMSGAEVADELRSKVNAATGLTCSAGVGPNRLLAKVCSDINKPNGQFVLGHDREAIMTFVSSLPIRKVNGIGKVTERLLKEVLGVSLCSDLLKKRSYISALFSQISTEFFLAVGLGIGGSETPQKEPRKSLSNERTFAAISDEHQLFQKLELLVELLADDMQKEDLQGRTLTLKLKETGFEVRSRAITLPYFISTKAEIWEHGAKLLRGELPLSLRLMGLRISTFKDENADPTQKTLASFITRSGASRGDQNAPSSDGSHHASAGLCTNANGTPLEGRPEETGHRSAGSPREQDAQDLRDGKNEIPETVDVSPRKDLSKGQQMSHRAPFLPITPPSTRLTNATPGKSPGSVQRKLQDLMRSPVGGLITPPKGHSPKQPLAPSTALKAVKNDVVDMRKEPLAPSTSLAVICNAVKERHETEETLAPSTILRAIDNGVMAGSRLGADREEVAHPNAKLSLEMDMEAAAAQPRSLAEDVLEEQGADALPVIDCHREPVQARECTIVADATESSWEVLQSGYDSVHEQQVWIDNKCALCGVEVNDCLPGTRQEHEDFHFAVWLQQQQGNDSGGLHRPATTITTRPTKKSSINMKRESRKRKTSGSKAKSSAHRKRSSLPIESFFSKAK